MDVWMDRQGRRFGRPLWDQELPGTWRRSGWGLLAEGRAEAKRSGGARTPPGHPVHEAPRNSIGQEQRAAGNYGVSL